MSISRRQALKLMLFGTVGAGAMAAGVKLGLPALPPEESDRRRLEAGDDFYLNPPGLYIETPEEARQRLTTNLDIIHELLSNTDYMAIQDLGQVLTERSATEDIALFIGETHGERGAFATWLSGLYRDMATTKNVQVFDERKFWDRAGLEVCGLTTHTLRDTDFFPDLSDPDCTNGLNPIPNLTINTIHPIEDIEQTIKDINNMGPGETAVVHCGSLHIGQPYPSLQRDSKGIVYHKDTTADNYPRFWPAAQSDLTGREAVRVTSMNIESDMMKELENYMVRYARLYAYSDQAVQAELDASLAGLSAKFNSVASLYNPDRVYYVGDDDYLITSEHGSIDNRSLPIAPKMIRAFQYVRNITSHFHGRAFVELGNGYADGFLQQRFDSFSIVLQDLETGVKTAYNFDLDGQFLGTDSSDNR